MKAFTVVLMVILCASISFGQTYSLLNKAPYSKEYYGGATFKADSHYVHSNSGWVTVTAQFDSTAGTVAYFAAGNDTLNAIPLYAGTGGNRGDGQTHKYYNLKFYRVKGAFPIRVTIE